MAGQVTYRLYAAENGNSDINYINRREINLEGRNYESYPVVSFNGHDETMANIIINTDLDIRYIHVIGGTFDNSKWYAHSRTFNRRGQWRYTLKRDVLVPEFDWRNSEGFITRGNPGDTILKYNKDDLTFNHVKISETVLGADRDMAIALFYTQPLDSNGNPVDLVLKTPRTAYSIDGNFDADQRQVITDLFAGGKTSAEMQFSTAEVDGYHFYTSLWSHEISQVEPFTVVSSQSNKPYDTTTVNSRRYWQIADGLHIPNFYLRASNSGYPFNVLSHSGFEEYARWMGPGSTYPVNVQFNVYPDIIKGSSDDMHIGNVEGYYTWKSAYDDPPYRPYYTNPNFFEYVNTRLGIDRTAMRNWSTEYIRNNGYQSQQHFDEVTIQGKVYEYQGNTGDPLNGHLFLFRQASYENTELDLANVMPNSIPLVNKQYSSALDMSSSRVSVIARTSMITIQDLGIIKHQLTLSKDNNYLGTTGLKCALVPFSEQGMLRWANETISSSVVDKQLIPYPPDVTYEINTSAPADDVPFYSLEDEQGDINLIFNVDIPPGNKEYDTIRLNSGARISSLDFTPFMNDGISQIRVQATIKPKRTSYYVKPVLKGIYPADLDDKMCLIMSDDLSLTTLTSIWEEYVYNNINYKNTFDTQLQHQTLEYSWQEKLDQYNLKYADVNAMLTQSNYNRQITGNIPIISDIAGFVQSGPIADSVREGYRLDAQMNAELRQSALNMAAKSFEFNIGNLKAVAPYPSIIDSFDIKARFKTIIEFWSTTEQEKRLIDKWKQLNGEPIGVFGRIGDYATGTMIRGNLVFSNFNTRIAQLVNERLEEGIFT